MKLRTGTLWAEFVLAAWMTPAGAAPVPCKYWNTLSFFIRADAADLARCLGKKALDVRDAAGRPFRFSLRDGRVASQA